MASFRWWRIVEPEVRRYSCDCYSLNLQVGLSSCCLPGDTDGVVKVLSCAKTDRMLGVYLVSVVSKTQNWCISGYGLSATILARDFHSDFHTASTVFISPALCALCVGCRRADHRSCACNGIWRICGGRGSRLSCAPGGSCTCSGQFESQEQAVVCSTCRLPNEAETDTAFTF